MRGLGATRSLWGNAGCSLLFLPYLFLMTGCGNIDGGIELPDIASTWSCDKCIIQNKPTDESFNDYRDGVDVCAADEYTAKARLAQACLQQAREDQPSIPAFDAVPAVYDKSEGAIKTVGGKTFSWGLVEGVKLERQGACSQSKSLSSTPFALMGGKPSNASFEGPVDWGLSFLKVEIPSEDDGVKIPIKGTVVMVGGNAPAGQQCDAEIWHAAFSPVDDTVVSRKGASFSNVFAFNHGVWKGTKKADTTLSFAADSLLSLSGTVKGQQKLYVVNAASYLSGKVYKTTRLKQSGSSSDNALVIEGKFSNNDMDVTLHIHAWITDCRSQITACNAWCVSIDPMVGKGSVQFISDAKQLGNMSAQDLCNAMNADDYVSVCETGVSDEFPTFSCNAVEKPEPPTPWERSKQFKYQWRDRNGELIGTEWTFFLDYMPSFPVTLTIENEWGAKISKTISLPPTGKYCPYPKIIHLEAEQHDKASGSVATDQCSEGGRYLGWINDGESVRFDNVNFGEGGMQTFLARISSATQGGTLTVRLDKPEGEAVATCTIPSTGGWQKWKTISCPLKYKVTGLRPVYLLFNGDKKDFLFNVNWIELCPNALLQMREKGLIDHIDSARVKTTSQAG